MARQAPWLAGLHKATDGLLIALGGSMIGLTALTLHWQGEWTRQFQQLESSQMLEHRLQEATSTMEQYHLAAARRPGQLVPTSIQKLIYVPAPTMRSADSRPTLTRSQPGQVDLPFRFYKTVSRVDSRLIRSGY